MSTMNLLRLEQVWRTLSPEDKDQLFNLFPEVFAAIELWLTARQ